MKELKQNEQLHWCNLKSYIFIYSISFLAAHSMHLTIETCHQNLMFTHRLFL